MPGLSVGLPVLFSYIFIQCDETPAMRESIIVE